MSTLTTVYFVGSLGRAIGHSKVELDVKSPAEAIRAMDINTRGKVSEYLSGPGRSRLYRIAVQKRTNVIGREEIGNRSGRSTIYIMPTIRGRNSGGGKILAGIAILALAYFTGGLAAGASGWAGAGATAAGTSASLSVLGTIAVGFGISLILGGITQLLTPTPQGPNASPDQAQSTSFPGNATSVVQGGCVPVVYGRALVSPVPVSITVSNNDIGTTAAGTNGDVDSTALSGGGTQYNPTEQPP